MSKGLVSFEKIKKTISGLNDDCISLFDTLDFLTIEKELSAFETIQKYVSIKEYYDEIFYYEIVDKQYYSNRSELVLSKEEYDLLKEFFWYE